MPRLALSLAPLALIALIGAAQVAHAQEPAFAAHTSTFTVGEDNWVADIYEPAAGPVAGTAIVAHGFTRSRERQRDLGRALASAGVVAIVPDLPWAMDPWHNADALVALVRSLETGTAPLQPIPRPSLVLIGTSAGGFATLMAAAEVPGIAGWIGLDPVDRTGAAKRAAARLAAPAIVLSGSDSTCNLLSSARSIAEATPTLLWSRKIEGAGHCDFESPTNRICTTFCGGSSEDAQRTVIDDTVVGTLELLHRSMAALHPPPAAAPPDADGGPGE